MKSSSWEDFDSALESKLNALKEEKVVLLTQTFASPSTSKLIKNLLEISKCYVMLCTIQYLL